MWYKRVCQVVALASAVVAATYGIGYVLWQTSTIAAPLSLTAAGALFAVVTGFTALFGFLFNHHHKTVMALAYASFILYTLTTAYVLAVTGYESSVFSVLWVIAVILAGAFGMAGLAGVAVLANSYIAFTLLSGTDLTANRTLLLLLIGELPLIISFLLWRAKPGATHSSESYSELPDELSVTSNKSEVVISAIADGVIALNHEGNLELINPAALKILGWTREDAMHLYYDSVIKLANKKGEIVDITANPIQLVLQTGQTIVNDELTLYTKSGNPLLVSLHISPVGNEKSGAIIVFRDITLEKKREREQAEFISTASHEMRTPVAAIEGYLGLALNPQTAQIDSSARMYLQKAHEGAQHLGRLFQDLLDISKAEDGRLTLNPTVVTINDLVIALSADFAIKAKEKGLFLHCPVAPDATNDLGSRNVSPVYTSFVDYNYLREVVSNLIENAIKYTKQGTVVVDVTGDESNVTITITDSGIGIPPEDIPHLFQKFYRVDNTDTREIGGTGLGLYLCRRLVETMNGRIWVSSELGKGSKFFLQIPRVSPEEAAQKAAIIQPVAPVNPPVAEGQIQ